jgi:hypothetical protein
MLKKFKVEIFCDKPTLGELIKKAFSSLNYQLHFNFYKKLDFETLALLDPFCDIIIADKCIEKELHEVIKVRFPNVPVICLPALEAESGSDENIKYISEPLKLSELKKVVEETLIK